MKSNYKKIIINLFKLVLFVTMIVFFIYFGTKDYEVDVPSNVRFANEYKDISKNNIYVYKRGEEINNILSKGSGIILLGFPSNIWSHYYADYLNTVAMENDISELYYYNFLRDRTLDNDIYESIVKRLKKYLILNDVGRADLSAPTVIVVKDGSVIYYNDELQELHGEIKPEEYFTDYKKNYLLAEFTNAIKLYKGELE